MSDLRLRLTSRNFKFHKLVNTLIYFTYIQNHTIIFFYIYIIFAKMYIDPHTPCKLNIEIEIEVSIIFNYLFQLCVMYVCTLFCMGSYFPIFHLTWSIVICIRKSMCIGYLLNLTYKLYLFFKIYHSISEPSKLRNEPESLVVNFL